MRSKAVAPSIVVSFEISRQPDVCRVERQDSAARTHLVQQHSSVDASARPVFVARGGVKRPREDDDAASIPTRIIVR
jgi:hypothetical protein